MNKKHFRKILLRFIFSVEVTAFSFTYLFGSNGLLYLFNLRNENQNEKKDIELLKSEIKNIQHEIDQWNTEDFHKEKEARKLQLARKNEEIYYLV